MMVPIENETLSTKTVLYHGGGCEVGSMTRLKIGQRVKSKRRITEGGDGSKGDPNALFPRPEYIHADKGDLGTVEGVDDGVATVRFDDSGTATIVADSEVKVVKGG